MKSIQKNFMFRIDVIDTYRSILMNLLCVER